MRRMIITALTAFLFVSCGGPEFNVAYKYVPPKEGKECLNSCSEKFRECQERCREQREKCLKEAMKRAEEIYREELKNYSKELSAYNRDYERYQRELLNWNNSYRKLYKDYLYFKKACKKSKDYYACERRDQLEEALDTLNERKPSPPLAPKKPELSEVISQVSKGCYTDCGCKEEYNSCFTSCGGEIIPYRFCVRNCE